MLSLLVLFSGPTRRFRRVCEKLQAAALNPCSVNPLSPDIVDFGHSNPSLSSDDTLAASTASPILDEKTAIISNSSREEITESALLVGGYESTDGESEDGLNSTTLLGI